MRKIATIAAVMALMTLEAGAIAQVGAPGPAGASQPGAAGPEGRRRRITDDPGKVILSLAALTEFILVFVIASHSKNGGRPASP